MKANLTFVAALLLSAAFGLQNMQASEITNTSMHIGKFYGIIVNANANVIVKQQAGESIEMEGELKAIRKIRTSIENGNLVIAGDGGSGRVTIYVSSEVINLIEVKGSARVFVRGKLKSDILLLKVQGSGGIRADVMTLTIGMIIKGKGKIEVSGITGDSLKKIYGEGNIFTEKLISFASREERYAASKISAKKNSPLTLHR